MSDPACDFDIVIWGATGFTGRLTAAHLLEQEGASGGVRWAIAGRSASKLEAVAEEISQETGVDAGPLPRIVADASDEASLRGLVERSRVVCTTVGPYAKYGSKLVELCAELGRDYCDLTGEVQWMRRMIDAHEAAARASGARIVHNCGFDCIPSDLGTYFVQREAKARFGRPSPHVKLRVGGFSGGVSGGTAASMLELLEEATNDPKIRKLMADPYGLNPDGARSGPDGADRTGPAWDDDFGQWTAPFVMAAINTRVVRRTNALTDSSYGPDFRYDEAVLCGAGPGGFLKAAGQAAGQLATMGAMAIGPLRRLGARALPQPGEGPSKAQREKGFFELELFAVSPDGPGASGLRAKVTGDRDPGYGSTSKMLAQSALCLAEGGAKVGGGFFTPAAAMGDRLIERLERHAGLTFEIEAESARS